MRYSKFFGKTEREAQRGMVSSSHKFLYQSGFVRESTAGRYYFLPLGIRVKNKIIEIIREEMNNISAQEMITPVLHPVSLWQETNRTNSVGFELMTVKDRRGAEFVLGGTAEEMFVSVVKQFNLSYRDLPFNIYQFSSKFRDELRSRGGLLRVREFTMKDAYSFDLNEKSFVKTYNQMKEVYKRIFDRLDLKTVVVEADNGYIGGDYCHEFVVENENGESRYLVTEDGSYASHEDVAVFVPEDKNKDEEEKEYKEVEANRGTTMEDGAKLHNLPLWQQIKDVMFVTDRKEMVLAVIRGDLDVNETKLQKVLGVHSLRHATEEEIRDLGSEPGFISPVGLEQKVKIVGDHSLRTVKNAYGGANKKNTDAININIDRDYKVSVEADIAMAQEGFVTKEGKVLRERRGIEVGNIFQLGYHYSKLMNATYTDNDGGEQYFYMGCYGIGIGRTMATIVETHHDQRGIVWPREISPFKVHLIGLNLEDENVKDGVETLYRALIEKNIEVLYDDRVDVRAGEKFADADLIGIPYRLVISRKTVKENKIEIKERQKSKSRTVNLTELFDILV
jgi:prolyl-tRNA synthetase